MINATADEYRDDSRGARCLAWRTDRSRPSSAVEMPLAEAAEAHIVR